MEPVDPLEFTGPAQSKEERFEAIVNAAVERGRITEKDVMDVKNLEGTWDSWHLHQQFAERRRKLEYQRQRKPLYITVTDSTGKVETKVQI